LSPRAGPASNDLYLEKTLIMTTILDNILSQFGKISAECVADLTELVFEKEVSKGEKLLEEGRICRNIYYVQQGAVRAFYYKDGKDITSWFSLEQDIAVAFVISCFLWCVIVALPFYFKNIENILWINTILLVVSESSFALSIFILGKEFWQKIKLFFKKITIIRFFY
jgi:hypothetical protein